MNRKTRDLLRRLKVLPLITLAASMLAAGCGRADATEPEDHGEKAAVTAAVHEHANPGETCFICDPAQREQGRLWCKEHSRYEDRCWLCHPELEDKDRLYCKEHSLYEDECFLCHPELKSDAASGETTEKAGATAAESSGGLFCSEHGVAEIECGICQPDLAASLVPGGSLKVRFPSAEAATKVGIKTTTPASVQASPGVEAICETQYNRNAFARVTPLAQGVIRSVLADLGESVEAGTVLVELHSSEVAAAKSEFLAALVDVESSRRTLQREKQLAEEEINARKDLLNAESAHQSARFAADRLRQKLVNLGFSNDEISEIARTGDASAVLTIRAPFAGTLVERSAVVGETAEPGTALFTVADLSTRWLMLSVPSVMAADLRVGQPVKAQFPELPGQTVEGKVTWIDRAIDPRSRLVRVLAEVTGDVEHLGVGLYGKALIQTGAAQPAVLVPADSVQNHERETFVFVQEQPDLFQLRKVALGARRAGSVEVLAGLGSGEQVVSAGAFLVMSEFLKSRLGAGCVDH